MALLRSRPRPDFENQSQLRRLQPKSHLIGPEPLQTLQRLIRFFHEMKVNAADMFNGPQLAAEKRSETISDFKSRFR
jgi:hypothetical protein